MIDRAMDDGFRTSEELEEELLADSKTHREYDSPEKEEGANIESSLVKPSIFAKLLLAGRKGKGSSQEPQ